MPSFFLMMHINHLAENEEIIDFASVDKKWSLVCEWTSFGNPELDIPCEFFLWTINRKKI